MRILHSKLVQDHLLLATWLKLATDIITFYAYTETEFEWVLSLDSAQLADGDTVKLRIVEDGGATCSTYTQYPTVTCRYVSDLMLGFHF